MLLLWRGVITAPIPSGPQPYASHIESRGLAVSGRLRRVEFFTGSSSPRLFIRLRRRACTAGRSRSGNGLLRMPIVRAIGDPGKSTFLSLEEAGLIELSDLDMHERFLARLTVSSLNLLRAISEQEGVPIEELNAGKICDWFVKDKAKREIDIEAATLKWDSGPEW